MNAPSSLLAWNIHAFIVCEINGHYVANGDIKPFPNSHFLVPFLAIISTTSWLEGRRAHNDCDTWRWLSRENSESGTIWIHEVLCHNLVCCHSMRQWWPWCIEQRGTGRTTLQKNDLIATGCRDACSLNMTRRTVRCFVSGVVALIRMSTGTSLSKGAVQWTVKAAQRCVSNFGVIDFVYEK